MDFLPIISGFGVGIIVGLTGVGGGSLMTPLLISVFHVEKAIAVGATLILLIYPRMETRRLVGTDIAHAVPLTLIAGLGHASLGNVEWRLLIELLIGSMPGIWIGSHLTKTLPDHITRTALCGSLLPGKPQRT